MEPAQRPSALKSMNYETQQTPHLTSDRRYSNGRWQRTDAGWYWSSEEPWAWATYHYGRWDFSGQFG